MKLTFISLILSAFVFATGNVRGRRLKGRKRRELLNFYPHDGVVKVQPDDFKLTRIFDFFGGNVSLDGNTLLVGAQFSSQRGIFSGAAYVFTLRNNEWVQQAKLWPDEDITGNLYGWNCAVSGDTAVIGAMTNGSEGTLTGAVFVFQRFGNIWSLRQKLVAPDAADHDYFGLKVGIDGDTIIVGCQYDDANSLDDAGSVYVFSRHQALQTWSFQQMLTGSAATEKDKFGSAIAIDGDTIVVGAPSDDETGRVYVFTRQGDTWVETAKIDRPEKAPLGSNFGDSVAVSGSTIAIGEWYDTWLKGAVYVYTEIGDTWTQQAKLFSKHRHTFEIFSFQIALEGDLLAVGGMMGGAFSALKGNVYLYGRDATTGAWSRIKTIRGFVPLGLFGNSVSISNGKVAIGAMLQGSAFVYTPPS